MQVQGDTLVLGQSRLGRTGQQVVEQGGHLPPVLARAEHSGERVPSLPCVGQVAVVDFDRAGFVAGEQQLA